MTPTLHAEYLVHDFGAIAALKLAEDFLSLGDDSAQGAEHWRLVVAALKRRIAAGDAA